MKKYLFIFLFILGAVSLSQAQNEESQRDYSSIIEDRVEYLTETLTLTDDQAAQVKEIYEKTLGVQSDDSSVNLSDQRHEEIKTLLNAEQLPLYEDYLENRSGFSRGDSSEEESTGFQRGQMDTESLIDSRVSSLKEMLTLSSDQEAQVRAIYEQTLGVESEDDSVSQSDLRHEEIKKLLNPEQLEIYQDYLDNRSGPTRRSSEPSGTSM